MTEKIPEGSRARVSLQCVVDYDDGGDDVHVRRADEHYGARFSVSRQALSIIRAPIQRPGALIHRRGDQSYVVVLYDAEAEQYVVRDELGKLSVIPDDINVKLDAPTDEPEAPLAVPEAPAQAERILAAAVQPGDPEWVARDYPIGTELGAEDFEF